MEYAQPETFVQRQAVANSCSLGLKLSIPIVVDTMDNQAETTFHAWPERLYVLSQDGTVLYQGGKGPYHFDPEELVRFIETNIADPAVGSQP